MSIDDDLGVVLFKVVINSEATWAILDNGAGNTIIDTTLAGQLDLCVEKSSGVITTTHAETQKNMVLNVSLEVPGQFKVGGDFVGADLRAISRVVGKDVGLVLGSDILRHLAYLVDSKGDRVLFAKGGGINPRNPNVTVISMKDGVIEGTLNGKPARFQIDLGSNSTLLILDNSWDKYFDEDDVSSEGRSIDLSGTVVTREEVENVEISFSGIEVSSDARNIFFVSDEVDGFLGFPIFRDRVTIFDYKEDRIYILPN